jgi:hypothetical protein
MLSSESPIEKKPLQRCSIGEFVELLASDAILPGAGAAGGVALALAAACAGKAVAVSRRHDSEPKLVGFTVQCATIAEQALVLGRQDAIQFKEQLKSDDPAATTALLRTDYTLLDACRELDRLLQDNKELIADNMAGDWKAARALLHACRVIHNENVRELKADTD